MDEPRAWSTWRERIRGTVKASCAAGVPRGCEETCGALGGSQSSRKSWGPCYMQRKVLQSGGA